MERMELLISQIRENTNLQSKNGVSDSNILRHFNHAQKMIQSLIYQEKLEPDIFVGTSRIVVAAGEVVSDLPTDVFAKNAILYVEPENHPSRTLDKIQSSERAEVAGYFIEKNQIGFSEALLNTYEAFILKYFKQLPDLDIRRGKFSSKLGNAITLTDTSDKIGVISDYITFVDKTGTIIQSGIFVESVAGNVVTVDSISADVTTDHYAVCGKVASTHSQLPDECLPTMLDYVEKRVFSKNASKETLNQATFSKEQEAILIGLFADNSSDAVYPPITDTSFRF